MKKNRYQLQQMLDGVRHSLGEATDKLTAMYGDTTSKIEDREKQATVVKDLEEREKGINDQLKALDDEAAAKLAAQSKVNPVAKTEKEKIIQNKASIIRAVIKNQEIPKDALNTLGGSYVVNALANDTTSGGSSLLPKTTSNEVITEPKVTNKLRGFVRVTHESNLEVPKLAFSCDDDDYIADTETAKEIKATGSTIAFGRYKSKVFCDVSETMLLGSDINLTSEVDSGLDSGIQAKERKMMFAKSTDAYYDAGTKHMSFYEKNTESVPAYTIKEVSATSKYLAIKKAVADLHEDYRDNAKIIMTYADYLEIIELLANGNASLYTAQPEQILGKPVIFMDSAIIPIVGDLSYLQINYHPDTISDKDKNVKTGMNTFVLTAWYDIQFRLRSAFRLATVTP